MKSESVMQKFVKWLDPRLEKYRGKKPEKKFTPKDVSELVDILRRTPKDILSVQEKNMFAAIMNISERRAVDLMIPKEEIYFVKDDEVLGPLNLDKLYKSGYSIFPVIDKNEKIIGVLKTDSLNSLEIKDAKKAKKYLDGSRVVYLNQNDTVEMIIDEFLKTNSLFFAIRNSEDEIIGMVTFDIIIYYLLGKI